MVQYVGNGTGSHPYQDWWALAPDTVHNTCYTGGTLSCNAQGTELASLYDLWQPPNLPHCTIYGSLQLTISMVRTASLPLCLRADMFSLSAIANART